jgi:hypothetical protein
MLNVVIHIDIMLSVVILICIKLNVTDYCLILLSVIKLKLSNHVLRVFVPNVVRLGLATHSFG